MRTWNLAFTLVLLIPGVAVAEGPLPGDAGDARPTVQVRGDQAVALEMACHPMATDFDDAHAYGDQLCVLVLEHGGQVALLGQWIQSGGPDSGTVPAPAPPMDLVHVARND